MMFSRRIALKKCYAAFAAKDSLYITFILANCTGEQQPLDVAVNGPMKNMLKEAFNNMLKETFNNMLKTAFKDMLKEAFNDMFKEAFNNKLK